MEMKNENLEMINGENEFDFTTCESVPVTNTYKLMTQQHALYPQLSEEEFNELFALYKEGNKEAEQSLILHNLGLCSFAAASPKWANRGIPTEDLYQVSSEGISNALKTYDSSKGKFSTYCLKSMDIVLKSYFEKESRPIKIDRERFRDIYTINKGREAFENEFDREPNDKELSIYLINKSKSERYTPEYIRDVELADFNTKPLSLDCSISDDDSLFLGDTISDSSEAEYSGADDASDKAYYLLDMLDFDHQYVIVKAFNIDREDTTIKQAAKELGVSVERFEELKQEALAILKDKVNKEEFLEKFN